MVTSTAVLRPRVCAPSLRGMVSSPSRFCLLRLLCLVTPGVLLYGLWYVSVFVFFVFSALQRQKPPLSSLFSLSFFSALASPSSCLLLVGPLQDSFLVSLNFGLPVFHFLGWVGLG